MGETVERLKGIGLGNRWSHRPGPRRGLAGVPEQFSERGPASSVGQQNSKSKRGERRAHQHQRIDCFLHILNTLPVRAGGPSLPIQMHQRAACIPAILPMLFLTEVATR